MNRLESVSYETGLVVPITLTTNTPTSSRTRRHHLRRVCGERQYKTVLLCVGRVGGEKKDVDL